ncbi:hypothetical protein [Moorella stamsii]|nr:MULTISPECIES: hypothetical protein [Moorella]
MVNGLRELYKKDFGSLLCTIDEVLREFYKSWYGNAENYIKQYVELSRLIEEITRGADNKFKAAIKFNQGQLLEAIRLLKELGISSRQLDKKFANKEQALLLNIMDRIEKNGGETFQLNVTRSLDAIKEALKAVAHKHIKEETDSKAEDWLKEVLKKLEGNDLNRMVFHGIHQFSPLMLDFIVMLMDMGIEVIFLFNFQEEYPSIYNTWMNIYSYFEVPREHDRNNPRYDFIPFSACNNLAVCFGNLLEGREVRGDLSGLSLLEFNNLTEFANYVAHQYDLGREAAGPHKALAGMKEQFYAASGEVNDILKMYYPEQFGERHFLAYPIGQFFSALYNMWNDEKNLLELDERNIKEVLNAGILTAERGIYLLSVYYRLQIYLQGAGTCKEFFQRLDLLRQNLAKLAAGQKKDLHALSFYNVTCEEVDALREAIKQLNEIAIHLFARDKTGYLNFKTHFQRLLDFLRVKADSMAILNEERELVNGLLTRLEHTDNLAITGTMDDLRNSVAYYLKQTSENNSAHWIVRNFEQIDGDILRSENQEEDKYYHFACLSDRQMQKSANDRLPWPLTQSFLEKAYYPADLKFQVYMTSINEYLYFMRYALFYGLCYNRRQVKLSFVRMIDDEFMQPYFLFTTLDIDIQKNNHAYKGGQNIHFTAAPMSPLKTTIEPTEKEAQVFELCPYRYFLEEVMERGWGTFSDEFLCKQYYFVLLVEAIWKKIEGKPGNLAQEKLDRLLDMVENEYKQFFPCWKPNVDLYDIKCHAKKYISKYIIETRVKPFDPYFIELKKNFIHAKLTRENSDENIVYFLHEMKSPDKRKAVAPKIVEYLDSGRPLQCRVDIWCHYCKQRYICLESFGA